MRIRFCFGLKWIISWDIMEEIYETKLEDRKAK